MEKFSISQIIQYMTCPQAYFYIYCLSFRLKKSDALFTGSALHHGLETFYKGGDPVEAYKQFLFTDSWQKPKNFDMGKHLEEGIRIMELYKTKGPYLEPKKDWIERRETTFLINPVTNEKIDIPFTFKWDMIAKNPHGDGELVVDHKSSKSKKADQSESYRIQAIAYVTAYISIFNKIPAGFVQNLIVKQKDPQFIPVFFQYTPDDINYVFQIIKYVIDRIKRRMFLIDKPLIKSYFPCPISSLCRIHSKN